MKFKVTAVSFQSFYIYLLYIIDADEDLDTAVRTVQDKDADIAFKVCIMYFYK